MKRQFTEFIKKHGGVYILKIKTYSQYIKENMEYAECTAGIHPNGSVSILKGNSSIVVSVSDMEKLSAMFDFSIEDLVERRKAVLYTATENRNRLDRKRYNSSTNKAKREERNKRAEQFKKDINKGIKKPLPLNHWIERTQIELRMKAPKYEQIVYDSLNKKLKVKARLQEPIRANGRIYFADIYIPRWKVALEVDGGYHNTPEQQEKDAQRDADLWTRGIRTIRIPNGIVDTPELEDYLKQIEVKQRDLDDNGNIKTNDYGAID